MSAEDLKKQGNAALQAGNVKEAILLYGQERIFTGTFFVWNFTAFLWIIWLLIRDICDFIYFMKW